jgi:MscS family membrane protein
MMETVITDANEMVMTIPNKQLSESRVINISRIKYSRIQQDIHFHYEDCQKLPMILDEIKREISSTCPMVVSDGSKPLRAYFKSYGNSFLEVEVDVRLRCQPGGEDFKKARQEVLLAIDRAVKRNNVKFAVVKEK